MNPLMLHLVDPFRDWLLSLGVIGLLAWIVLKILAIAVPVSRTARSCMPGPCPT